MKKAIRQLYTFCVPKGLHMSFIGTSLLAAIAMSPLMAQSLTGIDVDNDGTHYMLQSIIAGGYVVSVDHLATGVSDIIEGNGSGSLGTSSEAADNFDLNDVVARSSLTGSAAEWKISVIGGAETWKDSNGDNPDFFVFEAGGNDDIEVHAILSGGLPGEPITFIADLADPANSDWTATGLRRSGAPNDNQPIMGIAFAITDLLDDTGVHLTNQSIIEGIMIVSGGLDPCCFCAVIPTGPQNDPPVVDAGSPQTILWPFEKSVQLTGTATDDDLDIIQWSVLSPPLGGVKFKPGNSAVTTVEFPAPGVYILQLAAIDEARQRTTDTVTITVVEPLCPAGDIDPDCKVNISDLIMLADYWLSVNQDISLVGDENVDMADFAFFARAWRENWTGSVTVTLAPQQVAQMGAQWNIDNGPWLAGGTAHNDLIPGAHTVRFKPVDGWVPPKDKSVEIVKQQDLQITEQYTEESEVELRISEFMAVNLTTKSDENREYDDWLEIQSYADGPIDIGGMYLTDNLDKPRKWQIPTDVPSLTTIGAGGRLLIWADNEPDEGPLHAAFSLGADGGQIGLFGNDGVTPVHTVEYGRQVADISCGLALPEDVELSYLTIPTPLAANSAAWPGMVADTKFSRDRGFYDSWFPLHITCDTPGATIRYTTDGSKPTESHGQVFTDAIPIDTTATIRAFAYKSGWIPSDVDTQTYIFLEHVIRQPASVPGWPEPWSFLGNGKYAYHDYEMDPEIVDDPAYRGIIIKALKDIPTLSIVANTDDINMTANGGFYWGDTEKPCSIELMYPHSPGKNVQADCGVQPHSHNRMKRSMRLSFRAEYGDASFVSSIFQDGPLHGDTAVKEVDRIVLRGGNNRSWARAWNPGETTYTMDQWYRSSQVEMSGFGSRGTFVHLYINGLYWGLYNPVERTDHWFTPSYFGGEKEDWFSVSHGGVHNADASPARYNYMKGSLKDKDMTVQANYEEMQEYLDIPCYIDYVMLCWYIGMDDWPGGNWWGGNCNNPPQPFRYFAWDGEWSWETSRPNTRPGTVHRDFENTDSGGGATIAALWHSLRKNEEFMVLFADRAYKHLFNDGALTAANAIARYLTLNDYIRDAVIAESARWGDACEPVGYPVRTRDGTFLEVENEMTTEPGFMIDNVERFVNNLRAEGYYPAIDPPVFNQHGGNVENNFQLTMTNPNGGGTMYYTLDNTDPRQAGGDIAGIAYSGAITIQDTTTAKARVYRSGEWSALHEAVFTIGYVAPGSVIINEVLAHSDQLPSDFIELYNTTDGDIDIGGWFLSDSDLNFKKFQIPPGTLIYARDYKVFTEADFNVTGDPDAFALSESGEKLYLHSGRAGEITDYVEDQRFEPSDPDVSMGRYIIPSTGEDEFVAMAEITEDGPNSGPKVGPIVISEIMYHPANQGDAEYIELVNISPPGTDPVRLYEDDRNEAWHVEGIKDFMILYPNGQAVEMAPGDRILLVKNRAVFDSEFTADPSVKLILEWGEGSLDNDGENIELVKPGDYNNDGLQYIVVDSVDYSDGLHPESDRLDLWPEQSDGGIDTDANGLADESVALERSPLNAYGDDPESWSAVDPTPGG